MYLGGVGGIRTLDTGFSPYAPLAGVCLQPLSHYSVFGTADNIGSVPKRQDILCQERAFWLDEFEV